MSAKRAGLAFGSTRLVHIVHGPSAWLWEANHDLAVRPEDFAIAHNERRAAEQADTVVGPSAYLVGWMRDAGWQLPADQSQALAALAQRSMQLQCSVQDGTVWCSAGDATLELRLEPLLTAR